MRVRSWKQAELSDLATFERESISPAEIDAGTGFVGLENIDGLSGSVNPRVVGAGEIASTKFCFGPQHVLYGKLRPNLRKVGRPRGEGVCSTDILPILPGPQIDRDYLFHYLRQQSLVDLASTRAPAANLPRLSPRILGTFPIRFPPLPEQRRIAAILDKADAVRRKRQQTLDLADQFLRSAFLEMFGDPVTNPMGWPVKKLGELLVFLTSGSRGWAKYYSDEGEAFLRIQNVSRNRLLLDDLARVEPPTTREAERTSLQPGDVVLSITADLGRAAVVPESLGPAHVNQHLGLIRVKGIEPLYLAEFLVTEGAQLQFRSLDTGQTRSGLNFNDLKQLRVPCPPSELQKKFALLHSKASAVRTSVDRVLEVTGVLSGSLSQRAFRGEM